MIPSPISLPDLMQTYDRSVEELNAATEPSPFQQYYILRLVCSILLQILQQLSNSSHLETTLRQTARRCSLLEEYVQLQQQEHVESSADHFVLSVVVEPQCHQETTLWSWVFDNQQGDIMLSMSRAELEQEEAVLIQMASTPIPPDGITITRNDDSNNRLRLLQEQIQKAWPSYSS